MGVENTGAIIRLTYAFGGQAVTTRIINGSSTRYFIHNDHLGSNSRMSTSAGSAVGGSTARYTPFGDWRTEPTASLTDRGYTGHLHNNLGSGSDDLGLIYMNARYYLPSSGRFISPDTIVPSPANPQSLNRYSYVSNNPIKFIDPTGHCETSNSYPGEDYDYDYACWEAYYQLKSFVFEHEDVFLGQGSAWAEKSIWDDLKTLTEDNLRTIYNLISLGFSPERQLLWEINQWKTDISEDYPLQTIDILLNHQQVQSLIGTIEGKINDTGAIDKVWNYVEITGMDDLIEIIFPETHIIAQVDLTNSDLQNLQNALEVAVDYHQMIGITAGYTWSGWGISVNGNSIVDHTHLNFALTFTVLAGWYAEHEDEVFSK